MLDKFLNNPDLNKYLTRFEAGQTLFLEHDASQELYILVSGELDVLKGQKKISEISGKGALFGEMSLFLESRRTATVKAKTEVQAIVIPPDKVETFLRDCPEVVWELTRYLARRLDTASQILYGLNEFYDQLPDAVILTDKEGKILSWNAAAARLYGRNWDQMRNRSMEEIYEEPQVYREFLSEVQDKFAVRERILKIRHPKKGVRFISTSMNVLYDGHHNFQGVFSLGRDVTDVQKIQKRYRRIRNWVIPSIVGIALLAVGAFVGYPYFTKGYLPLDTKKQDLKNQLAKDFLLLRSVLAAPFAAADREKTSSLMHEFFEVQEAQATTYTGLVLLTPDKRVFDAYAINMDDEELEEMVGNSYAGIPFQGTEESIHRVLSLYRVSREHPMGYRGIEVAFGMKRNGEFLGWLLFQMDTEKLDEMYGLDEEGLIRFRFKEP
ncbi:MAG: cyclic nucleotide-binding domain-containing protein [Desulfobacteraceae bacterium]|jgi:PAS domain S-box-containing protein